MKALLVGLGGIGANVYYPELQKLGYEIETVDERVSSATYKNINEVRSPYDISVVCTPNFTHAPIAKHILVTGTKTLYIEKPGVSTAQEWWDLSAKHRDARIHLVKNNLYRDSYGEVLSMLQGGKVIGVDINWINDNRIPNPGSWFTTKNLSFGGVSHDLMPHMYCFAVKMFGREAIADVNFKHMTMQRWNLENITSTDYGRVNRYGEYNVDDTAMAIGEVGNISLKLYASWKEGYNKQSITLYFSNGTTYEWEFGLCPAEAYGVMLQDNSDSLTLDMDIHRFLEDFRE